MNYAIRRAALRATAKVALSLTALGCSGSVTPDFPGEEQEQEEDYEASPGAEAGASESSSEQDTTVASYPEGKTEGEGGGGGPVEPERVCQAPLEGDVAPDSEQLECCLDFLTPAIDQSQVDWDAWAQYAEAPAPQACCHVVLENANQDANLITEIGWQKVNACCGVRGNPEGIACTPWGPPVPPAVLGALPYLEALVA